MANLLYMPGAHRACGMKKHWAALREVVLCEALMCSGRRACGGERDGVDGVAQDDRTTFVRGHCSAPQPSGCDAEVARFCSELASSFLRSNLFECVLDVTEDLLLTSPHIHLFNVLDVLSQLVSNALTIFVPCC